MTDEVVSLDDTQLSEARISLIRPPRRVGFDRLTRSVRKVGSIQQSSRWLRTSDTRLCHRDDYRVTASVTPESNGGIEHA